jgi:hypothetical protein
MLTAETLVILTVTYGSDRWIMEKKKDRKTIGAFQRWVWRKILSVP